MKILVTGSGGFVGSNLVDKLKSEGKYVCGCVRNANNIPKVTGCNRLLVQDICDSSGWREALADIDILVHCAGRAHKIETISFDESLNRNRLTNVQGTMNVARNALKANVARFIFISSIGVNGAKTDTLPFTHSSEPNPVDPYSISKYEAEIELKRLFYGTEVELVIVRPPLIYGIDAPGNMERLWKLVESGYPIPLGALTNMRSLISIENLVDFLFFCCTESNTVNDLFLVSDDWDVSTADLVRIMYRSLERSERIFPVPYGLLKGAGWVVGRAELVDKLSASLQIDPSHAKSVLNWYPQISPIESLKNIGKYRNNVSVK